MVVGQQGLHRGKSGEMGSLPSAGFIAPTSPIFRTMSGHCLKSDFVPHRFLTTRSTQRLNRIPFSSSPGFGRMLLVGAS